MHANISAIAFAPKAPVSAAKRDMAAALGLATSGFDQRQDPVAVSFEEPFLHFDIAAVPPRRSRQPMPPEGGNPLPMRDWCNIGSNEQRRDRVDGYQIILFASASVHLQG
jgi:hypothetical protein